MGAEERLATFLLNLSQRYRQRGYSSTEFVLRLTRRDIGSYLGMTLETVSRLFSRFQAKGLIKIEKSLVRILDLPGLKTMSSEHVS
jgi:CRP/FNR family transcriptional regulator, anaerobic regulatory protein